MGRTYDYKTPIDQFYDGYPDKKMENYFLLKGILCFFIKKEILC